jgi:NAD(P)-dependent dehydrogenase (short-subunit alcohol dehydrogenase family)
MIYGAAGYTGSMVAERAASAGLDLVLAGREKDRARLEALAGRLDAGVRLFSIETWTKRRLIKALHQSWHQLGKSMPCGTVLPNLSETRKRLAFLLDLFAAVAAGWIDIAAITRGEPDDAAPDLFDKHGTGVE